jgi:hypothetical protein
MSSKDHEALVSRRAIRNTLLGLWVAQQLNLSDEPAKEYARDLALADLEEPGDNDLIRKILNDFNNHGKKIQQEDIVKKIAELNNN